MHGAGCRRGIHNAVVTRCSDNGETRGERCEAMLIDILAPNIQNRAGHVTLINKGWGPPEGIFTRSANRYRGLFLEFNDFRAQEKGIVIGLRPGSSM
jgi:hypothetical protein